MSGRTVWLKTWGWRLSRTSLPDAPDHLSLQVCLEGIPNVWWEYESYPDTEKAKWQAYKDLMWHTNQSHKVQPAHLRGIPQGD